MHSPGRLTALKTMVVLRNVSLEQPRNLTNAGWLTGSPDPKCCNQGQEQQPPHNLALLILCRVLMSNAASSIDVKWSSISTCPFISCTAVHNYRSAQFLYSRSGWWGSNVVLNRQHCASVQVYRHANSRLGEAGCRGLKTQDLTPQSIFIHSCT